MTATDLSIPETNQRSTTAPSAPVNRDRPLTVLCVETVYQKWSGLGVVCILLGLYAAMTLGLWAPADGGVDQNAYLLGGRLIAEHGTPRYALPNPYAYVGGMFIRTSPLNVHGGNYYPKYPFGLPLLYASFFWIAGATRAASLVFLVSPIASILAAGGMFFLTRLIAGSFAGVMAMILLGTSQLMIELSNNPNSHAACLAFVIWGMYWIMRWWQSGRKRQGILAGFLLGYAGLIRYSEALLVLPIAVACASRLRWTDWRSYLRSAIPGLAWAVPIGALFIFNKCTMGNWTGYDSTNESEGFTWLKFTRTWEQMIRTYYDLGAFFVLPFGVAGLAILFGRSWRLGLFLLAWILPGTALYTSYYWSPDRGISYARFILTFLPVVMLGAVICFSEILSAERQMSWYRQLPRLLGVGIVVMMASSLGAYRSVHGLQGGSGGLQPLDEQYRQRKSLANLGQVLLANVPAKSVIFADNTPGAGGGGNEKPLNYIQFLRDWDVYESDAFTPGAARRETPRRNNAGGAAAPDPNADPNAAPTPRQPLQLEYVASLYSGKSSGDLRREFANVIDTAHQSGHRVFALVPVPRDRTMRTAFNLAGKYRIRTLQTWNDLTPGEPDPVFEAAGSNQRRGNGGAGRRMFGLGTPAIAPSATNWELLEITPAV